MLRPSEHQQVERIYDTRAGLFDPHEQSGDVEAGLYLIPFVLPSKNMRILDLGCGEGGHLRELAVRGYTDLHGIDISQKSIDIAKDRCASYDITFTCGDIAESILEGFDLITAFNSSLGSFGREGDAEYIGGAAAALKPGGLFILCYVDLAAALRRKGRFRRKVLGSPSSTIYTNVRLSPDGRWMTLKQHISGKGLPTEAIRVMTRNEVKSLLTKQGLLPFDLPKEVKLIEAFPNVAVIVARKTPLE